MNVYSLHLMLFLSRKLIIFTFYSSNFVFHFSSYRAIIFLVKMASIDTRRVWKHIQQHICTQLTAWSEKNYSQKGRILSRGGRILSTRVGNWFLGGQKGRLLSFFRCFGCWRYINSIRLWLNIMIRNNRRNRWKNLEGFPFAFSEFAKAKDWPFLFLFLDYRRSWIRAALADKLRM